jgi:hypothetical protein
VSARIRIGLVGGNAERGWARDAHVPAVKHLADTFELAAVSARTQEAAEAARSAMMVLGCHGSGCVSTLEVVRGTADKPFLFEREGKHGRIGISGGHPDSYQAGVLTLASQLEANTTPAVPGLSGPRPI